MWYVVTLYGVLVRSRKGLSLWGCEGEGGCIRVEEDEEEMQLHLSPSMRSITISSSNSGSSSGNGKVAGLMTIKVAARHFSYGTLFQIILLLAFLLPFVFILTAIGTLKGCLSRPWGTSFLGRAVDSERLVRDFYMILNDANNAAIPDDLELPDSFNQLVTDMKNNNYETRTFVLILRAMNLKTNLSMWKLVTLPPAVIAFKGHVHPIDPSWHVLGLGYQNDTNIDNVNRAAVIHYNGQAKPWLQIGFEHLRPFWTKYVNTQMTLLDIVTSQNPSKSSMSSAKD